MDICEKCKSPYEPKRSGQKYCSDSCRTRAWQLRTGYYARYRAQFVRTQGAAPAIPTGNGTISGDLWAQAAALDQVNPITGIPYGKEQHQFNQSVMAAMAEIHTQMKLMEMQHKHERELYEKDKRIEKLESERAQGKGMGAVVDVFAGKLLQFFASKFGAGGNEKPVTGSEVHPNAIRAEQVVFLPTDEPQEPEQKPTKL